MSKATFSSNPNKGKTYRDLFYCLNVVYVKSRPLLFLSSLNCLLVLFWPNLFDFTFGQSVVFVIAFGFAADSVLQAQGIVFDGIFRYLSLRRSQKNRTFLDGNYFGYKADNADGCVYLIARISDGIYKIGKSTRFDDRFKELNREYNGVVLVAIWEIPNINDVEKIALDMTMKYQHEEEGRSELRAMTDSQVRHFIIDLTDVIEQNVLEWPPNKRFERTVDSTHSHEN